MLCTVVEFVRLVLRKRKPSKGPWGCTAAKDDLFWVRFDRNMDPVGVAHRPVSWWMPMGLRWSLQACTEYGRVDGQGCKDGRQLVFPLHHHFFERPLSEVVGERKHNLVDPDASCAARVKVAFPSVPALRQSILWHESIRARRRDVSTGPWQAQGGLARRTARMVEPCSAGSSCPWIGRRRSLVPSLQLV